MEKTPSLTELFELLPKLPNFGDPAPTLEKCRARMEGKTFGEPPPPQPKPSRATDLNAVAPRRIRVCFTCDTTIAVASPHVTHAYINEAIMATHSPYWTRLIQDEVLAPHDSPNTSDFTLDVGQHSPYSENAIHFMLNYLHDRTQDYKTLLTLPCTPPFWEEVLRLSRFWQFPQDCFEGKTFTVLGGAGTQAIPLIEQFNLRMMPSDWQRIAYGLGWADILYVDCTFMTRLELTRNHPHFHVEPENAATIIMMALWRWKCASRVEKDDVVTLSHAEQQLCSQILRFEFVKAQFFHGVIMPFMSSDQSIMRHWKGDVMSFYVARNIRHVETEFVVCSGKDMVACIDGFMLSFACTGKGLQISMFADFARVVKREYAKASTYVTTLLVVRTEFGEIKIPVHTLVGGQCHTLGFGHGKRDASFMVRAAIAPVEAKTPCLSAS